jgi:hypothetical protein
MEQQKLIKFNTFNTRRNLPSKTGRKRGEANFLGAFERKLRSSVFTSGYGGKQFSLSNYGIADFIWVTSHNKKIATQDQSISNVYAFETKLKNWRKAFQQAYRYSYFADISCIVIPPEVAKPALKNLELFKTCNVGLWLFDHKNTIIEQVFTPTEARAKNITAREKALTEISSRVKFC